jgi:dienelactone hydrolase
MGCVVFHYDMVGYADSQQIPHRTGFTDAEAELRLQSFMGLQTFNSLRALDFLAGLPDVDPRRIGVTGASGGGTQTFILCAIDNRPAVAFPAVMVSTAMQGGCICENCSYLRQGAGNIDLAGLFAPKPLGMTGANDWTREIETKGLPELKALYRLYGAEDRVMARAFVQFDHNYNQVSRDVMYNWFNKHLHLEQPEPVKEKPFVPVPPKDLSVFDEQHPHPGDAADAKKLRDTVTAISNRQLAAIHPTDAARLREFRHIVGTALRVMIHDQLPSPQEVEYKEAGQREFDQFQVRKLVLGRKGQGEQIPAVLVAPADANGTIVVWIHPAGKASLIQGAKWTPAAHQILAKKGTIIAPDVFLTGEFAGWSPPAVNPSYAGYTFGYNRPLLANRVHDILTAVAFARGQDKAKTIHLVGFEQAGPWVILARALCSDSVARTAADVSRFRFEKVDSTKHEMMLPGALKYGGLPALAALCAPGEMFLHNDQGSGVDGFARDAYQAAGVAGLLYTGAKAAPEQVVRWLLR